MKPSLGRWVASIAVFGCALALTLPVRAQSKNEYDLNDVGHRGVGDGMNFYSLDKEIALGKTLAQQVEAVSRIQKDPVVNEYVNRIAQNLVRNSDAKVPFTVTVVESTDINAAALPGGYFFVNTGLILAADNESELAGAMAHEIAHVAARHGTRNATKGQMINYATIPLIFVGGGVGLAGRSLAEVAVPMSFLKFDRNDEREADFLGMQYMYLTGYDPQSFINFFEKIEAEEKHQPGSVAKAFETHPPTPDRVRASEKEMATVLPPRPEYIVNTSEFDQVKARLAMLEHETATQDKLHPGERPSLRHPEAAPNSDGSADDGRPTLERRDDGGTTSSTSSSSSTGNNGGSSTTTPASSATPPASGTTPASSTTTPASTASPNANGGTPASSPTPASATSPTSTPSSTAPPSTPPIGGKNGGSGNGNNTTCCASPTLN